MTRQQVTRTHQRSKSEPPLVNGILQRAAIRTVPENEVQPTDQVETPNLKESRFHHDFTQVPIHTNTSGKENKTGMPDRLKTGMAMDNAPVHAPAAVDFNQLAIQDPLSFLNNQCQGKWEEARQYYRQEKITQETMLSLVDFRGKMVGDKSELVDKVIKQTLEYVINKNKNLEKQHGLKGGSLGQPKQVKFSAPGSQSPTSDIDYNLKGDGTEFAVKIFNELFKQEFGYEAGTFFDVNVYSKDFLPDVFSAGNDVGVKKSTAKKNQELLDKFNNPEEQEKLSKEDKEKAGEIKEKDLKPRDGKGTKEFELQGGFDAMDIIGQEIYSLVKIQMYMTIEEWQTYRKNAVEGLGEESPIKKEIEQKFDYAEVKYRKYLETIVQGIDNSIPQDELKQLSIAKLKHKREEAEHKEFDKTLAAHNRAYEAKLLEIEELRDEIKVINAQILQNHKNEEDLQAQAKMLAPTLKAMIKKSLTDAKLLEIKELIDKVQVINAHFLQNRKNEKDLQAQVQMLAQTVKAMINESLTYANEAYLTEGGVAHVVGTKQIKANLTFSADQYVQAFNENIGDAFKELTRHETDGHGYAAVKAGKYIHRAANEAKHYGQQANEDVQNLDPNRKMNQLGKELETVKNAGKASEANNIGLGIVKKNLNIDNPTTKDVKQELQSFAKRVTQSYNQKKHS